MVIDYMQMFVRKNNNNLSSMLANVSEKHIKNH
jgi:hypothetical protein